METIFDLVKMTKEEAHDNLHRAYVTGGYNWVKDVRPTDNMESTMNQMYTRLVRLSE